MKIVSIKRLVLALILGLGSLITLPAYAWPDTDEMNMCGAAVKKMRAYGGDHRGWSAHDNYIKHLGAQYYQLANCPESKATKNYKGKYWTPKAKMAKVKVKPRKVRKVHKRKHKKTEDCIRTDLMNSTGPVVRKVRHGHQTHDNFYRQTQAVLNKTKVKRITKHQAKGKEAGCIITDGLNNNGAVVRVVSKKRH